MKFTLEIECDNAAFGGDMLAYEIARILTTAAEKVRTGHPSYSLRDANGNRVGAFEFAGD